MAITVTLYKNKSDSRCMQKDLEQLIELSCDVFNPCDRLNPTLVVDKNQIDWVDTNYCWIDEFERYYFITDITATRGNKVEVQCHVDVLMTYDSQIRDCPLIAARSTNNVNYYLQDEQRLFNSYVKT